MFTTFTVIDVVSTFAFGIINEELVESTVYLWVSTVPSTTSTLAAKIFDELARITEELGVTKSYEILLTVVVNFVCLLIL